MKKYFLSFLLLAACGFLYAQNLDALRETISKNPAVKDAQYSVYARYIGGEDIISINPDSRLSAASILKLYTTAAALDILGPDYRFKTEVYISGKQKGAVVYGDIYIKGGGDPTLGSIRLLGTPGLEELTDGWAQKIKELCIKKIEGAIYADNSIFSGTMLPWRTSFQNIGNYYAAPVDGLSARDNSYEIYFEPARTEGEIAKVLKLDPHIKGIEIKSYVKAYSRPGSEVIHVNFNPGSNSLSVVGGIKLSQKPLEVSAAMPSPALFLADYLKEKLEAEGVKVKGAPAVTAPDTYDDKKLILTHLSPPLWEIIKYTNKRSFNLYADIMVYAISAFKGGPGAARDGILRIKDFLARLNIDSTNFNVFDGSGLSRDNITSCAVTVNLLEAMRSSPHKDIFYDSLPVAGDPFDSGNMWKRLRDSNAALNARVKTGSLDRARSHAGYVKDKDGRDIVFCIVTNNFKGNAWDVSVMHEEIINSLAGLTGLSGKK